MLEKNIADYVSKTTFEEIPAEAIDILKTMVLTVIGTTIGGSKAEGCESLAHFYLELGGKKEASILLHGGKIPAHDAAFVNSVMARALDYCDAMAPGLHIGASVVPVALASSEMAGGCSGKEFLTALALGAEIAARLNLSAEAYAGLDPTGIAGVYGATATACRILGLRPKEIWSALGMAFNRCGGSLQSNIDASLAVRLIQGWVAQTGITCARFAGMGITGPKNFLEGVYGYYALYGKQVFPQKGCLEELGREFKLMDMEFKKYPCCALTQGGTEAILEMMNSYSFHAEDVEKILIHITPYANRIVGQEFRMGDTPRVNAQFSLQYCVANALLRKRPRLMHFDEEYIKEPGITRIIEKTIINEDSALEKMGKTALEMRVLTKDAGDYFKRMDIPPGFPNNPLPREAHESRFWDCFDYAETRPSRDRADRVVSLITHMEQIEDVRSLIPLLLA